MISVRMVIVIELLTHIGEVKSEHTIAVQKHQGKLLGRLWHRWDGIELDLAEACGLDWAGWSYCT